jgi:hypothetical protein
MDSSLAAPTKDVDVHMDAEGLDFTCGTCHKTSSHDVAGSRYTPTAKDVKGVQVRGKAGSGNPGHLRRLPRQCTAQERSPA